MPYDIKKKKGGYVVIKKRGGKVMAGKSQPLTLEAARGYVYHAGHADEGKK